MRLFIHGIDDIRYAQWQREVLNSHVVGIFQLDVANTEVVLITVIATLVKSSTNGQSQTVVIQEVVVRTHLSVSTVCLLSVSLLVSSGKEVAYGEIDRNLLGGNGYSSLQPVTSLP